MKILMYSNDWAPTIGGAQIATMTLARGLSFPSQSHTFVTLVTPTPAAGMDDAALPFEVVRHAGIFRLIRLLRNQDVIHVAGPAFLPLLIAWLLGKKLVVQHHGYQAVCPDGSLVHAPDGAVCANHFLEGRPGECVRCRTENVRRFEACSAWRSRIRGYGYASVPRKMWPSASM